MFNIDTEDCLYSMDYMRRFTALLFSLFLVASCGRTWVRDQESPQYSAITLYADFNSGFVKGISFKNLSTGAVYENQLYGWGKEFFPTNRSFSFAMVGNLPPGRYALSSFVVYERYRREVITIRIEDTEGSFILEEGKILYIGDILLGYARDAVDKNLKNQKTTWGEIRVVDGKIDEFSEPRMVILHTDPYIPGKDRYREGEENFLDFIISKQRSLARWADIAAKRRAEIDILKTKTSQD